MEVGVKYQQFLLKLLELTLNSLNVKGHELEKNFAEYFIAFAYFRIPSFRNDVLEAITRSDDPEIIEWRGTEYNLTSQENIEISKN